MAAPHLGQVQSSFGLIGEVCPGIEPVDRGQTRCLTIFEPQIARGQGCEPVVRVFASDSGRQGQRCDVCLDEGGASTTHAQGPTHCLARSSGCVVGDQARQVQQESGSHLLHLALVRCRSYARVLKNILIFEGYVE